MTTVTMSGKATDLELLFLEHYRFVYRTAYGIIGNPEDAKDVLQTIFLRLLRREHPPDLKQNPKSYLHRAAVNESLNTIQARKRRKVTITTCPDGQALSDGNEWIETLHQRLYQAMGELDGRDADMLVLRYVHDYSDAEIGRLIGKSRGAVAVRLYRARTRLKKLIEAKDEQ